MTSEQCGKGIIPRSLILTDEFLVEGWSVVAVIFSKCKIIRRIVLPQKISHNNQ